ncbi:MAG: 30S ribosomal protein S9 [Opitutales bacterium]|nr:30S ribosomal protein S9 [Opitutales bacterium]
MSTLTKKVEEVFVAVGRRKEASARVRLTRGSGEIVVNGRELETYCYSDELVNLSVAPLKEVGLLKEVDITVNVKGGGPNGQAIAISHGIARALQKMDAELRAPLKKKGYIRRDPRAKERKKVGQPGARRKFQFSKR